VVACVVEDDEREDKEMSEYLKRNESIGAIQEMAIRMIMSRHKREDLRSELLDCGMPWVVKLLGCCEVVIEEIRWPRTRKLLLDGMTFTLWKCILGSGFRPIFVEILYNIVSNITKKDLEQWRKPPGYWRVNKYAAAKQEQYKHGFGYKNVEDVEK